MRVSTLQRRESQPAAPPTSPPRPRPHSRLLLCLSQQSPLSTVLSSASISSSLQKLGTIHSCGSLYTCCTERKPSSLSARADSASRTFKSALCLVSPVDVGSGKKKKRAMMMMMKRMKKRGGGKSKEKEEKTRTGNIRNKIAAASLSPLVSPSTHTRSR